MQTFLHQTLIEDQPPFPQLELVASNERARWPAENGPDRCPSEAGYLARGLADNSRMVGSCAEPFALHVLETISYPRTVPFKAAWSWQRTDMPQLVSGSGEVQNRIKQQIKEERDGRPIKAGGCRSVIAADSLS